MYKDTLGSLKYPSYEIILRTDKRNENNAFKINKIDITFYAALL